MDQQPRQHSRVRFARIGEATLGLARSRRTSRAVRDRVSRNLENVCRHDPALGRLFHVLVSCRRRGACALTTGEQQPRMHPIVFVVQGVATCGWIVAHAASPIEAAPVEVGSCASGNVRLRVVRPADLTLLRRGPAGVAYAERSQASWRLSVRQQLAPLGATVTTPEINAAALEMADIILFGDRGETAAGRERNPCREDAEKVPMQQAVAAVQDVDATVAAELFLVVDGRRTLIPESGISLGRDSDLVDVVLENCEVSRRHARVQRVADGIGVVDLDSTNGTVVRRGKESREVGREVVRLAQGDRLFTRHGVLLAEVIRMPTA